jgi:glycosyltransferase involved in cell wall biosynthesis
MRRAWRGAGVSAEPFTRLRVAMLSYRLPVEGQKRGGIERAADTLAQGLVERGHHVVVFSHDPRPAGAPYQVRPLPWKTFVDTWIGRRLTMGYLGNVLAVLPDYRDFDVVVAHGDSLLLGLSGKPVLRVMHGSARGEAQSARSWGRSFLQYGVYVQELATAALQRGVVAVSENTRHDNPTIAHVIPHGVDRRVFHAVPGSKSVEPSVLFVGTLDGRKRGRLLLDVFTDTIRPLHPLATLTVVGQEGPARPGVVYRTGVSDAELAQLYRRAWVYASPSTYEGFGLPYLEAMACGTVVVATRNPGSLEVLGDGEYGLMPSDEAFGTAVAELLGDEALRVTLCGRGLRRAGEFSLEAMIERYEDLLMELTSAHARPLASH